MRPLMKRGGALLLAAALTVTACGGGEEASDATGDGSGSTTAADDGADETDDAQTDAAEGDSSGSCDFYDGDTVRMIIPFDAGGGTDVNGRFLAEWYTREMDNVTVQAENVPGGGSILGANEFELQTERDGMTIFLSASSTLIVEQLGQPEVRYSTKNWTPVMGVPHGGVAYIDGEMGLEEDLSNIDDMEFNTAMREPGGVDTLWLLAYELLGINVNPVFGYGGSGATRVAIESGETNLDWQTTGAYQTNVQPMVDDGSVVPLFAAGTRDGDGVKRHEAHPDVPTVAEVYEQIHGEPPSGELWEAYLEMNNVVFTSQRIVWVHNDAPEGVLECWQQASQDLVENEEFVEAAVENLGPYTILAGDEVEALSEELSISEENVGFITEYLESEYDYRLE